MLANPQGPKTASPDFLLIGGGFFGYSKDIIAALEARGRKVIWFEDRPATDTLTKALVRLSPMLVASKAEAYFEAIARQVEGLPIRDVLVIKAEAMSPRSVQRLRRALPKSRFTLYFWDSYKNMPRGSSSKVDLFDRTLTFDPGDAARDARLRYRPLWYADEYAHLPDREKDIDVLFVGTVHTDRYAVLQRLAGALPPRLKFEKVLYFPSKKIYRVRKLVDSSFARAQEHEFIFKPLSKSDIQGLLSRTHVVVDIERSVQEGLTMRTIEMLGAGKKLITTNPSIQQADFFRPENVAVIDRERPEIPSSFFDTPYAAVPPALMSRYSLSGWLSEVVPPHD